MVKVIIHAAVVGQVGALGLAATHIDLALAISTVFGLLFPCYVLWRRFVWANVEPIQKRV